MTGGRTVDRPAGRARFAIGFWVDPTVPPARFDAEYRVIADANFTVLLGGYGATKPPEVTLQIAAARLGLYPIVTSEKQVLDMIGNLV